MACLAPSARADAPSLQVSPLQYQDELKPGHIEQGYVDVSNPGDSEITVDSSVQGFRQVGTEGNLEFFTDPDTSAAIKVGLNNFILGPREAVRVVFNVDGSKLPQGGTYAAIFFRTQPPAQASSASFIAQSANVGTLLLLTNGPSTPHHATISRPKLGLWQFGNNLTPGSFLFTNTDHTPHPVGVRPELSVRVLPWGHAEGITGGLVLAGISRQFSFVRHGSYLGPLPVTVTDKLTGAHATAWIIACTGWYRLILPAVLGLLVWLWWRRHRRKQTKLSSSR
jgi:hypothetical protein